MATLIVKDAELLYNGFDLTGFSNQVTLTHEAEALDETVLGLTTRKMRAGLKRYTLEAAGWVDLTETTGSDEVLHAGVGVDDAEVTLVPEGITAGNVAYFAQYVTTSLQRGGTVGELWAYTFSAEGSGNLNPLVRGVISATDASKSASYTTAKIQVGATVAGQSMFAVMHVIAFNGSTLDADLRSDADNSGGGETVRASFTQATGVTSELISDPGAVTDEWWDIDFTFSGTSFTAIVAIGIV